MTEFSDEPDRSFLGQWTPAWSDFERKKYLVSLFICTRDRLRDLSRDPVRNAQEISFEKVVLSSTQKELKRLEYRLSLMNEDHDPTTQPVSGEILLIGHGGECSKSDDPVRKLGVASSLRETIRGEQKAASPGQD
ncbi:MAG: hypothetical protein FJY85_21775 [Deltaproteobacteria bacterium]|nr:hypothetical protein [Deltaproteobacteria bacterium]